MYIYFFVFSDRKNNKKEDKKSEPKADAAAIKAKEGWFSRWFSRKEAYLPKDTDKSVSLLPYQSAKIAKKQSKGVRFFC